MTRETKGVGNEPVNSTQTTQPEQGKSEFPPYKVTVYAKNHSVYDKIPAKYIQAIFAQELTTIQEPLTFSAKQEKPGFFRTIVLKFKKWANSLTIKVAPLESTAVEPKATKKIQATVLPTNGHERSLPALQNEFAKLEEKAKKDTGLVKVTDDEIAQFINNLQNDINQETQDKSKLQDLQQRAANLLFGPELDKAAPNQSPNSQSARYTTLSNAASKLESQYQGQAEQIRKERLSAINEEKKSLKQNVDQQIKSLEANIKETAQKIDENTKRQTALPQEIKNAQEREERTTRLLENSREGLNKLHSERQNVPKQLEEMQKARQEKWDAVVGPEVKKWDAQTLLLQETLDELEAPNKREDELTKKGDKIGFFEKMELNRLMSDRIPRSKKIQDHKDKITDHKNAVREQLADLEKGRLGDIDSEVLGLEAHAKDLPNLIKLKQEEIALKSNAQITAKSEREKLESEFTTVQTSLKELSPQLSSQIASKDELVKVQSQMEDL